MRTGELRIANGGIANCERGNCELRMNRSALAIMSSKLRESCEWGNCELRMEELRVGELRIANGRIASGGIASCECVVLRWQL